jgi:hypothetical protein
VAVRYAVERDLAGAALRLVALPMAAATAAVFLVPLLAHWPHVSLENILGFHYADNFLGSAEATDRVLDARVTWIAAVGAVTCGLVVFTVAWLGRGTAGYGRILGVALTGLACVALMSAPAEPLWRVAPLLQVLGYPWRLLTLVTVCGTLGLVLAADRLWSGRRGATRLALAAGLVAAVLASATASVHVLTHLRVHAQPLDITPAMAEPELHDEFARLAPFALSLRDVAEYRPRWSVGHDEQMPHSVVMPAAFHDGLRALREDGGGVEVLRWEQEQRDLRVGNTEATRLLLRTFYYPAWEATAGGLSLATSPHPRSGLMLVDVPAQSDVVELRFRRSGWHALGWLVSLAGLCALLAVVGLRWRLAAAR